MTSEYLKIHERRMMVSLWYPRSDDSPNVIEIDLVDVRASDGIRVEYDFDRDGWVIKQMTTVDYDASVDNMDEIWE